MLRKVKNPVAAEATAQTAAAPAATSSAGLELPLCLAQREADEHEGADSARRAEVDQQRGDRQAVAHHGSRIGQGRRSGTAAELQTGEQRQQRDTQQDCWAGNANEPGHDLQPMRMRVRPVPDSESVQIRAARCLGLEGGRILLLRSTSLRGGLPRCAGAGTGRGQPRPARAGHRARPSTAAVRAPGAPALGHPAGRARDCQRRRSRRATAGARRPWPRARSRHPGVNCRSSSSIANSVGGTSGADPIVNEADEPVPHPDGTAAGDAFLIGKRVFEELLEDDDHRR